MKPQEDRLFDQEKSDYILPPLTNKVNTDTTSPEDEAELAQIWQHEPSFRESVKRTLESGNVASAKMRP